MERTRNIDEHFKPKYMRMRKNRKGNINKLGNKVMCRTCNSLVNNIDQEKHRHLTQTCRRIAYEKLKYRLKYLPNDTVEMICEICNWKKKTSPNVCLMHRRTCSGFGDEDYRSIYKISGFELLSCIIEHIRGKQMQLPALENETLRTDDAEGQQNTAHSMEIAEDIQPINFVEIQIDSSPSSHSNDSSMISREINIDIGLIRPVRPIQTRLNENQQDSQSEPVDLITVYTRSEANDSVFICFMCRESSNRLHYNLRTSRTKYTRQQLAQILGIFLDVESNVINDSDEICSKCHELINEYDLATETVNKVKLLIQQRIMGENDLGNDDNTNNLNNAEFVDSIEISDDEIDENKNEMENAINLDDDHDDSVDIVAQ